MRNKPKQTLTRSVEQMEDFMIKILALQISVFGDYSHIKATPELAAELVPVFDKKLFPTVSTLNNTDHLTGAIHQVPMLRFFSVDQYINISFLPNRIDCNLVANEASFDQLECKANELFDYLKMGINYFGLKGNRMAFNGHVAINDIDVAPDKYLHINSFFKNEKVTEWSTSLNKSTTFMCNESEETLNNILNLQLAIDPKEEAVVLGNFDINTLQDNQSIRFDSQDFSSFLENAVNIVTDMLKAQEDQGGKS